MDPGVDPETGSVHAKNRMWNRVFNQKCLRLYELFSVKNVNGSTLIRCYVR